MSLSVDGFWKAGFWSQTFWADGFWYEGEPVPPPEPTVNTFGGVKRRHPKVIIEREEEDEEQEEIAEVVQKVKRLIARKITNKQIAQKVQTEVVQTVKTFSIDLTQATQLMNDLKEQEIKARMKLKQLRDDEEAIKFFL